MQSGSKASFLSINIKALLSLFSVLTIISLILFRNIFFQPTLILKSLGELSTDPVIAFNNNKPTFLEFYAEWCEVCKEMAPQVSALKDKYEKDVNFVFLNVDNPKWQNYMEKFNVNGIPQVNMIDKKGNLISTLIGKQEEQTIKDSINNLNGVFRFNEAIVNSDSSQIRVNRNHQAAPRSHG